MQMKLDIDIYVWKKLEHRAAEEGRNVEEFAAEVLEKEAEKEHEKVFAKKVEATRLKAAGTGRARPLAVGVEATRFSARRHAPSCRARKVEATRREA